MKNKLIKLGIWLLILLIWEFGVEAFNVPTYKFPSPTKIAVAFLREFTTIIGHSVPTLIEVFTGFGLGSFLGFSLAIVIVYLDIDYFVYPFIVMSQSIPKIAIAPIIFLWFGHGLEPKIVISATMGFFPVAILSTAGLKSVERDVLDAAKVFGASRFQILIKMRIPYCLPMLFEGLKMAIVLSFIGSIVGEFLGADKGLGYLITVYDDYFSVSAMFAAIAFFCLLCNISYSVISWIGEKVVIDLQL